MSLPDFLRKLLEAELAAEGITPDVLEMIDLSIAYSPVIPLSGGGLESAVEVRPWGFPTASELPERFEVMHPLFKASVDHDGLKIMRARFLLARDARFGPAIREFFSETVEEPS